MTISPYRQLIDIKRWADRGLCAAVKDNLDRLSEAETAIIVRIFDHIHTVDRIFQHHLEGKSHGFRAAQSDVPPAFDALTDGIAELDDWYVSYVEELAPEVFEEEIDFVFTSGKPVRMTRGEILLHISLHGTYHRGNAGALLQLKGLEPSRDAITDYLEDAR
ncbi:DinB family protein [Sphingopyxis panaciterrae]